MARDGRHQELGFGVVIDDRSVLDFLGRQFDQEAYFSVENREIYCIEIEQEKRVTWIAG